MSSFLHFDAQVHHFLFSVFIILSHSFDGLLGSVTARSFIEEYNIGIMVFDAAASRISQNYHTSRQITYVLDCRHT